MKICSACGVPKPLDEFHRDRRNLDGRQGQCKPCRNAFNANVGPDGMTPKQRWRQKNPGYDHAKQNRYVQGRAKSDAGFKLKNYLRTRIYKAVKGTRKSDRTLDLLGCTLPDLLAYLESKFQPGMSWENYGPVWHIDHKRPCASFDLTDPAQQKICFHWTNLQPLFASDNLRKGARVSLGE